MYYRLTAFVATTLMCCAPPARSASPGMPDPALTPLRAELYHAGWVDLNKNGTRDPYEDAALEVEARLTDLLERMTMAEKTAQMVTLYGFPRVRLAPGATRTVHFSITPEHLELYDRTGNWVVEPGSFSVMIGASSTDVRLEGTFTISDGRAAPEAAPARPGRDDPI